MPRQLKTTCRIEGCEESRHVYPCGAKSTFCTKHNRLRKSGRKRGNLPPLNGFQEALLRALLLAKNNDWPWVYLPDGVHPKTLRYVIARDWVYESKGLDGKRYMISTEGESIFRTYQKIVKRTDGLCPTCKKRPRKVSKNGRTYGYCGACLKIEAKAKYDACGSQLKPGKCCSRCKKRPRYVASSGRVYCYCKHCKNLKKRQYKRRKQEELRIRIQTGEFIPCAVYGCDEPCAVYGKSVYDYCRKHYAEYQRDYRVRQNQSAA